MYIEAKIIPNKVEIGLTGKGSVVVDCAFQVGKLHPAYNQSARISVTLTDKLRQVIEEEILPQIGEKITKEEEE